MNCLKFWSHFSSMLRRTWFNSFKMDRKMVKFAAFKPRPESNASSWMLKGFSCAKLPHVLEDNGHWDYYKRHFMSYSCERAKLIHTLVIKWSWCFSFGSKTILNTLNRKLLLFVLSWLWFSKSMIIKDGKKDVSAFVWPSKADSDCTTLQLQWWCLSRAAASP